MESLGVHGDVMRRRVEETLDLLGLADVRQRTLRTLSGGQQQRVAIGGVLAAHPRILVLDEPTSALDPVAAEEVLAALTRLVHDLGLTVLLAEHRLERVVQYDARWSSSRTGRSDRACPRPQWPSRRCRRPSSTSAAWPAGRRCLCQYATRVASPGRCAGF